MATNNSIGSADDAGRNIVAFLASVRTLRGSQDLADDDRYQRGRAVIERLALSCDRDALSFPAMTVAHCADALYFLFCVEPVDRLGWWVEPELGPDQVGGYYALLRALEHNLRRGLPLPSARLERAHRASNVIQFPGFRNGEDLTPVFGSPPKKPCPFCGCTSDYVAIHEHEHASGPLSYSVQCSLCFGEGPSADSWLEAAELWNHRPGSEPTHAPSLP